MTYKSPQISDEVELYSIVDMFQWDYRRMYIEHPRVRLDGVYIAVCHYMFVSSCHSYITQVLILCPSFPAVQD